MEFLPLTGCTEKRLKRKKCISQPPQEVKKKKVVASTKKIKVVADAPLSNTETDKRKKEKSVDTAPPDELNDERKCRLFVKLREKIVNVSQVTDLHPDIVSVRYPRKKNSKWCWAIFETKEKALSALKQLKKNNSIIVNKPDNEEKRQSKLEKSITKAKAKKSLKKNLRKSWA